MRASAIGLILAWAVAAGAARPLTFEFLELRLPAPAGAADAHSAPFHLVYPETLGTLPVRPFLLAPDKAAESMLSGRALAGSPLSSAERDLLLGLRALTQGRSQDAHAT